jgi:hypothetical protein
MYVHWFVKFVDAFGKNCLVFPQKIPRPWPQDSGLESSGVENKEKGAGSGNILHEVVNGGYKCLSTMQAGYLNSRG